MGEDLKTQGAQELPVENAEMICALRQPVGRQAVEPLPRILRAAVGFEGERVSGHFL